MKISCIKEKIREPIIQAEKVTGKNLSLPILSTILLSAKNGKLTVRATNLDLGVEFDITAKIEKEGEVAIPGSVFSSVLSNIHDGKNIELELINENIVISSDGNTILVKSFAADDFPIIPSIAKEQAFTVDIKTIISGIKSVWYSSAVSDIKPEIASVYLYYDNKHLVFVATDSFRLAEKRIPVKEIYDFSGVIIPIKNLTDIVRILDGVDGDVIISFDDNQISFSTNNIYITSRIVNGVYPDYSQIIPKDFQTTATLLKSDMDHALKLTNIFTDKFNKVNIKTNKNNNIIEINSRNSDIGENITQIKSKITGDDIDVNFNYKYINEGLQSIQQDSVILLYNTEREVLVMRGMLDNTFTYLVKPMNK